MAAGSGRGRIVSGQQLQGRFDLVDLRDPADGNEMAVAIIFRSRSPEGVSSQFLLTGFCDSRYDTGVMTSVS